MKLWLALLTLLACALPAAAADWTVERIRGSVTQQIDGTWRAVSRGDVVPSNRVLRTGGDGRAALRRNAETIELSADTQIRLGDAGDALMTTVYQDYGVVAIEAERRNVQHFSVQTPYLAAVVKGTRFVVRADANGASVDVQRGVVQVQDKENSLVTDIRPGQEATVGSDVPLTVTGSGDVAVFRFDGQPVVPGTTEDLVTVAEPASATPSARSAETSVGDTVAGNSNGAGRSEFSNAGGNGNGNGNVRADVGSDSVSVSVGGNGNSNGNNAGGNSNGAGNSEASNAGGNGNGNVRVDVSDSVSVSVGGNGNSNGNNAGGNSNGAGNSESSHAGGNHVVEVDVGGIAVTVGGNGNGNGNGLLKRNEND
ncbi:FecR family protein [Devosia sp. FKR38]|uniref:FecR family protein n=1 Tax=Devosia sp. FKR38 TaxID=2562312 RepID=UPI001485C2F4|nr:FecR family protein [Devosia sp. FKR38]